MLSVSYSDPNFLMGYTYVLGYKETNLYYFQPYSQENELRLIRDSPLRIRRKCSKTPGYEPILEHPDEDEDESKKVDETKTPALKPILEHPDEDEDDSMFLVTSRILVSSPQQHTKKISNTHSTGDCFCQHMKVDDTGVNIAAFPIHSYVCREWNYPSWSTAS